MAAEARPLRVVIIDDHALVREGLRRIIEEDTRFVVAGEAASGREGLALVQEAPCDVVVLDLSLPDRSGLELLKSLRIAKPGLPVLVVTMHGEEEYGVRAMRADAAGYLTKESAGEELVTALRSIVAGRRYLSPRLADLIAVHVASSNDDAPHGKLSDREYEILCAIGSGRTLADIGRRLGLSIKTVSTYRARLLGKLQLESTPQLVRYAIEQGLVATTRPER
jgi:two-component system, NarL family, invasion response regulator UvrY